MHISKSSKYRFLFVLLLCSVETGRCQDACTQQFPNIDSAGFDLESLTKQFVVPHYKFLCSAVVTAWEAIVHIEKVTSTIQFQVWRWNHSVSGYQLVGANSFTKTHGASAMLKEIKYVCFVHQPKALLRVEPDDIVGVYVSGMSVHYESDDSTEVYTADLDAAFEGTFAPSNLDPAFNQRINGAPLISVQIDESSADAAATDSHLVTLPRFNTTDSLGTPQLNATVNTATIAYGGGTAADVSNRQMIIGVSITGAVMVLLCAGITIVSMALIVRAQKRKRVGIETTGGRREPGSKICPGRDIFSFRGTGQTSSASRSHILNGRSNGIHKAVLLTESHSANQTDEEHSYAYINSEVVISTGATPLKPFKVSTKPPTLPPARIAVGKNPCYSLTPATSTEELDLKEAQMAAAGDDKRVENVYDLPVFPCQPRQAREYEVPIKTLPTSSTPQVAKPQQHIYELTDINEYV